MQVGIFYFIDYCQVGSDICLIHLDVAFGIFPEFSLIIINLKK